MGSHEKDSSSPKKALSRSNSTVSSKHSSVQQGSESWEVVEEPRTRGSPGQEPQRHEGYLLKKRKWPLKGWHKRYFVLENGILKYATTRQDVLKGKLHGAIDVRQSVMSVNKKAQRVDLDTEENIYHLKIKSPELFTSWVSSLCSHHQGERPEPCPRGGPTGRTPTNAQGPWTRILPSGSAPALSSLASSRDKVNAWLKDSEGLERCSAELSECQAKLQELTGMLQSLEALHRIPSAPLISGSQPSAATERPKKARRTTKIWCTQSFAKDDTIGRAALHRFHSLSISSDTTLDSFASLHPDEPDALPAKGREQQLSNRSIVSLADSHTEFFDACEVFLSASSSENEPSDDESCISEATTSACEDAADPGGPGRPPTGTEERDTGAEGPGMPVEPPPPPLELPGPDPRRRSCLPAPPAPPGDVSLWGLLRSSVGKDLSRVALPVQLNEPLNTLQRLCEELEYSALLDRASRARDPRQRLVYVAAFAVSAYASTYYRAGSKPFNPVLGETYECVRPDRGFRFISEQVCHHPPISACHAESDNFIFWQDMRWKNKFWGKSLEIVPVGTVNVQLPRTGDHFEWNKVTTCIHNVLSGPRWIEHYGEVLIRNTRDASYHCKITFCKARYWGAGANEVQGAVLSRTGTVVERLAGKWHEGLHRGPAPGQCVWRANPMPRDHERSYGFTQFALELNELTPELRRVLPSTDTRLRPDQRYLEEGNVPAAETQKRQIEQLQRDRRRVMEENNITHQARFFRRLTDANGKESWVTNNTYWKLRLDPGFAHLDSAVLW
ncbi:oxysterol-binding protein-related protein 7 isoform X4 [Grus americana]|uniref:oxysterol-binding protein-related protein 7 isoform X4 n=1 Tax=Grus americana TaxID=9117 RepID=UPI002407A521|nr:oxysterol-binding protein-related protein 7 isoform X4 [Grus americana]